MNLGQLLNAAPSDNNGWWIIVLGVDGPECGAAVDEVEEVKELRSIELLEPENSSELHGLLLGITADALMVIDGATLLADERLFIEDT